MIRKIFLIPFLYSIAALPMLAQLRPDVGPRQVNSPAAATIPFTIQAAAAQSNHLLRFQSNLGVVLSSVQADGTFLGPVSVLGGSPGSVTYTGPDGKLNNLPNLTYDPVNQRFGFFTAAPTAPFTINSQSLFSDRITVANQGAGTFTLGPYNNDTIWNQSVYRIGSNFNSDLNEFGLTIQVTAQSIPTTSGYEKTGVFILAQSADATGMGPIRDLVGIDSRGQILPGNTTGRVWGGYFEALAYTGADGALTGIEVGLANIGGADQPQVDNYNSKTGIAVIACEVPGGCVPGTTAIGINTNAGGNWHRGLWSREDVYPSSITSNDAFIELMKASAFTDMFRVKPDGQTIIGDLPNNSSLGDYDPAHYGSLTVAPLMTIASTEDTNKHLLVLASEFSQHIIGADRYDNSVDYWPMTFYTAGAEAVRLSIDPFMQLTTSYTGANQCASGTAGLRNAAGNLQTCQDAGGWVKLGSYKEVSSAPAGVSDEATVYAIDNGSGKTKLMVQFGTGSPVQLAIEP